MSMCAIKSILSDGGYRKIFNDNLKLREYLPDFGNDNLKLRRFLPKFCRCKLKVARQIVPVTLILEVETLTEDKEDTQ